MPDGRGGYQKPSNPAPASGPGALSKRTDGAQPIVDIPDADYGEQAAFHEQQQGAPMAQSSPMSPMGGMGGGGGGPVTPFDAESAEPGTPVTDGAVLGAGAGAEALGLQAERNEDMEAAKAYLPVLEYMANQPGASWAVRNYVRQIKSGGVS